MVENKLNTLISEISKIISICVAILLLGLIVILGYSFYTLLNVPTLPTKDFCGWSTEGACIYNSDCVAGGCSDQVCQSKDEGSVITTCEWKDCFKAEKYGLGCYCIRGKCQWSENASAIPEVIIRETIH
jgi:eight-cysteine-cluster-containing protein